MSIHECSYHEVKVANDDGDLRVGMRVLTPCECGDTPLDALHSAERLLLDTQDAWARFILKWDMPLYHWSPAARRKQIYRYGLRPNMRQTTNPSPGWRAPWACFAQSPLCAWSLSGGQSGSPDGEWDLWMTRLSALTEPIILPTTDDDGIHEVRTCHRVYKRHLHRVATRISEATT